MKVGGTGTGVVVGIAVAVGGTLTSVGVLVAVPVAVTAAFVVGVGVGVAVSGTGVSLGGAADTLSFVGDSSGPEFIGWVANVVGSATRASAGVCVARAIVLEGLLFFVAPSCGESKTSAATVAVATTRKAMMSTTLAANAMRIFFLFSSGSLSQPRSPELSVA